MQLAAMTETRTSTPMPPHEVMDGDKLAALVVSMETSGWIGAPVLVDGEQALTGSHRIAAAARADVAIPRVEVRDLCAAHGLDWDELLADNCDDWYMAGRELVDLLPVDVVNGLGVDLH